MVLFSSRAVRRGGMCAFMYVYMCARAHACVQAYLGVWSGAGLMRVDPQEKQARSRNSTRMNELQCSCKGDEVLQHMRQTKQRLTTEDHSTLQVMCTYSTHR